MLEDEMLTIDDLAAYLKLKPQTIYKWAQTGKIPGAKFGKEWRFRRSAIERWIDSLIPAFEKPAARVEVPSGAGSNSGEPKVTGQRREGSSSEGSERLGRAEAGAKGVPAARLVSSREAEARPAGVKGAPAGEGGTAAAKPRKSAKLKKKPRGPESN